jgi:hypothetical protein
LDLQDTRNILYLAFRGCAFRPLQLRNDDVFRLRDKDLQTFKVNFGSTIEFCNGERPRFANDEIDLPSRRQVDDVESMLTLQRVKSIFQVEIVFGFRKNLLQSRQLLRGWSDHDIEIV